MCREWAEATHSGCLNGVALFDAPEFSGGRVVDSRAARRPRRFGGEQGPFEQVKETSFVRCKEAIFYVSRHLVRHKTRVIL